MSRICQFKYRDNFKKMFSQNLFFGNQPSGPSLKGKSKQEIKDKKLSGIYEGIDSKTGNNEQGRFSNGEETGLWKEIDKDGDEIHYQYSRERVGAICGDGTRSYATGRGACSWHGGVAEWLYESVKRRVGGTGKYVPIETRIQNLKTKIKVKLKTNKLGQELEEEILKTTMSLLDKKDTMDRNEVNEKERQKDLENLKTQVIKLEQEKSRLEAKVQEMERLSKERNYQLQKQVNEAKEKAKGDKFTIEKSHNSSKKAIIEKEKDGRQQVKVKKEEEEEEEEEQRNDEAEQSLEEDQQERSNDGSQQQEEEQMKEEEKLLSRKYQIEKEQKKFMSYQMDLNEEYQKIVNRLLEISFINKKTIKKQKDHNEVSQSLPQERSISENEKTYLTLKKNEKILDNSTLKKVDESEFKSSHLDSEQEDENNHSSHLSSGEEWEDEQGEEDGQEEVEVKEEDKVDKKKKDQQLIKELLEKMRSS